jgi:hypothetical protein
MAEIYSTFEAVGHDVYLGRPIERHLNLLARLQNSKNDPAAARRTLEPLLLPGVEAQLRADAGDLLRRLESQSSRAPSTANP